MNDRSILNKTIQLLFPFLWPKNHNGLKIRIVLAIVFLLLSKITNLISPPILGSVVDSLTDLTEGVHELTIIPIALIIAYGLSRIATKLFGELRNAIFSKVSQNAIRQLTLNTFAHLHSLSLQFHLNRKTGALSKFIDRGTKGVDFLMNYFLFNVIPTIIEIFFVAGILFVLYGFKYAVVTLVTILLYIYLTYIITQWRLKFRRRMNEADNMVSSKLVDSLLNYETVKYFNNENYEFDRLDNSLKDYEGAAVENEFSSEESQQISDVNSSISRNLPLGTLDSILATCSFDI